MFSQELKAIEGINNYFYFQALFPGFRLYNQAICANISNLFEVI